MSCLRCDISETGGTFRLTALENLKVWPEVQRRLEARAWPVVLFCSWIVVVGSVKIIS